MAIKSQNEEVLEYLQTHEGITSMDAFTEFGITRLSGRIYDLRNQGHNISSCEREAVNRKGKKTHFTEYRLVKSAMALLLIVGMLSTPCGVSTAKTKNVSKAQLKAEGLQVPSKLYTSDNVKLLAKLIQAENGSAKHDKTLWLTGAVVLKRVKAKSYPNTVKGVIYQSGQYSTANKLTNVKPSTRAYEIAEELLIYGVDDLPDNLVFQSMFPQGKKVYKKIDGEYFCLA